MKLVVEIAAVLIVVLLLLAIFQPSLALRAIDATKKKRPDAHEYEHGDARAIIEARALNEAATRAKYPDESALARNTPEPRGM